MDGQETHPPIVQPELAHPSTRSVDSALTVDEIYSLYCEFTEQSRQALLRICVQPESRRVLSDNDEFRMSKDEFVGELGRMPELARREYIRQLTLGYHAVFALERESLLQQLRPDTAR
ncbi:MAG: hypothetical protein U0935_25365 [Pirellulales bacterium]